MITRRRLIGSLAAGAGGLFLAGCDKLDQNAGFKNVLRSAEGLTLKAQRLVTDRSALAREFGAGDISPVFRPNGNVLPASSEWQRHAASGFRDWRLRIDGLVHRPLSVPLDRIMALPRRTQITRHDCVEGWSAIGMWTGAPLSILLDAAGLRQDARYIVFHCADSFGDTPYYESIDLVDAFHPQTILAWALNRHPLPVQNGAPLRLRVERQLGYKHAKFVMRIEAVSDLSRIHGGKGGYWEDSNDYAWYAGI
jgi:DMSO/TMAO reductase YedYZ molybdopterin-dependent catalytic subunit